MIIIPININAQHIYLFRRMVIMQYAVQCICSESNKCFHTCNPRVICIITAQLFCPLPISLYKQTGKSSSNNQLSDITQIYSIPSAELDRIFRCCSDLIENCLQYAILPMLAVYIVCIPIQPSSTGIVIMAKFPVTYHFLIILRGRQKNFIKKFSAIYNSCHSPCLFIYNDRFLYRMIHKRIVQQLYQLFIFRPSDNPFPILYTYISQPQISVFVIYIMFQKHLPVDCAEKVPVILIYIEIHIPLIMQSRHH